MTAKSILAIFRLTKLMPWSLASFESSMRAKTIWASARRHQKTEIAAPDQMRHRTCRMESSDIYFTRRDGEPITIAGLWDSWHDRQTSETINTNPQIE